VGGRSFVAPVSRPSALITMSGSSIQRSEERFRVHVVGRDTGAEAGGQEQEDRRKPQPARDQLRCHRQDHHQTEAEEDLVARHHRSVSTGTTRAMIVRAHERALISKG